MTNYEFDPRLTGRGLNSYAEGMAEGNGGIDTGAEEAEAKAQAKAEAAKAEAEKTNTSQRPSPDAEYLGKKLEQNTEELNRIRDKLGSDIADNLATALRGGRAPSPGEMVENLAEKIRDPRAVGSPLIDEAFFNARAYAKKIIDEGEATPAIQSLANAPDNLSRDAKHSLLLKATQGEDFAQRYQKVAAPPPGHSLPGSSIEADSELEYLNMYYPPSLEDVGERAEQVVSPEFKTGGKYEIIHMEERETDRIFDGKREKVQIKTLRYENLLRWMRKQWLVWGHQFSPDDPRSDPFSSIQILSYTGGIGLGQMVTNERYWQKKEYVEIEKEDGTKVVKMREKQDRYGNKRWEPEYKYVKDKGYDDLRNAMIMEFYMWGKNHMYDASVRTIKTADADMHKKVAELLRENAWLQGQDRLMLTWKLSATSGSRKDIDKEFSWMGKGKEGPIEEGRLGKAHRLADTLYFRMGHIQNENDKENVFFNRLENAGKGGKREFFRSMIRRGLDEKVGDLEDAALIKRIVTYRAPGLDRSKDVELQNIDLAEILFRTDKNSMTKLFTEGDNAGKVGALNDLLAKEGLTLDNLIQKALNLREQILEKLPGHVNFQDITRVRDLFSSALGNGVDSNSELEELGMRFIDTKLEIPQGDKWSKAFKSAKSEIRKQLNLFNESTKPKPFEVAVRKAIQDAIGRVNNLDDDDAEYAENLAFSKVYWTFSAGFNDTTATGFDGSTKTQHMMGYRENNFDGGKNAVGNIQNLYGVKRTVLPFWMAMYGRVDKTDGSTEKKSLLSVMETGFTDDTKDNSLPSINFDRTIETTYAGNHITKGWALYERHIKGAIFDLAKYVTVDAYGRVQTKPEAIQDVMSKVNNEIRYTFNQMSFDFEDEIETLDVEWVREANGNMKANPVFKKQKLKDFLFDKEIVNMGMYERRMFEKVWPDKHVGLKDINGEDILTEYSRNVLAWLLSKEILEHRLYDSSDSSYNYNIWELGAIQAIEGFFANIPMGGFDTKNIGLFNKNKRLRKRDSFFNAKEFKKIRLMGNAGYGKLWFEALRAQVAESAWKGNTGTGNKFFAYIFQDMWSFK